MRVINISLKEFLYFIDDQDNPKNNNDSFEVIYENDVLNPWKLILKK